MSWNPSAWKKLGQAIRDDRERQGLTRQDLADLVVARGGEVSDRTIATLEKGPGPKQRDKYPKLEITVAALGWKPGYTDRILDGEPAESVLHQEEGDAPSVEVSHQGPNRDLVFELLPRVYEFSRTVVALGGDSDLRDRFDAAAQRLAASLPSTVGVDRRSYGLATYRPHAEGEAPPADDADRIRYAMEGND